MFILIDKLHKYFLMAAKKFQEFKHDISLTKITNDLCEEHQFVRLYE